MRPDRPAHPRLAMLGQLEGRLVDADLVILGGLNEGSWPPAPESGPWLNRAMRAGLGLPPAEQAIGIAAHDFLAAAGARELVLSRAAKDEHGDTHGGVALAGAAAGAADLRPGSPAPGRAGDRRLGEPLDAARRPAAPDPAPASHDRRSRPGRASSGSPTSSG